VLAFHSLIVHRYMLSTTSATKRAFWLLDTPSGTSSAVVLPTVVLFSLLLLLHNRACSSPSFAVASSTCFRVEQCLL